MHNSHPFSSTLHVESIEWLLIKWKGVAKEHQWNAKKNSWESVQAHKNEEKTMDEERKLHVAREWLQISFGRVTSLGGA